jgi:hypothetical protein
MPKTLAGGNSHRKSNCLPAGAKKAGDNGCCPFYFESW